MVIRSIQFVHGRLSKKNQNDVCVCVYFFVRCYFVVIVLAKWTCVTDAVASVSAWVSVDVDKAKHQNAANGAKYNTEWFQIALQIHIFHILLRTVDNIVPIADCRSTFMNGFSSFYHSNLCDIVSRFECIYKHLCHRWIVYVCVCSYLYSFYFFHSSFHFTNLPNYFAEHLSVINMQYIDVFDLTGNGLWASAT